MGQEKNYKSLINDIIIQQTLVLGPDIVLFKARSVRGLTLNQDNQVQKMIGNPDQILEDLVNSYVALSGQILKTTLQPIFAKYPDIKIPV